MPADLMPFGFTATESMVYSTLLRLGPATGYAVARAVRLARANAYGALDGLVSRGAAVRIPGRPTRYRPADPQALLAQITAAHGDALDRFSRALADAGRAPSRGRSLPGGDSVQRALRHRRWDPDPLCRRRDRGARRVPARSRRLALHVALHPPADHARGVSRHRVRQPGIRGLRQAAYRVPQRRLRAARNRLAGLAPRPGRRAGGTLDGRRGRRRGGDPRPAARARPRAHRRGRTGSPRTPAIQAGPLAAARPPHGLVPRPGPH